MAIDLFDMPILLNCQPFKVGNHIVQLHNGDVLLAAGLLQLGDFGLEPIIVGLLYTAGLLQLGDFGLLYTVGLLQLGNLKV